MLQREGQMGAPQGVVAEQQGWLCLQLVIRENFPRYIKTKTLVWVRTLKISTPLRVQYPYPVPCLFSFPDSTLYFSEGGLCCRHS